MRNTIIRTATFATIFILPLSLPQSPNSGDLAAMFGVPKASADGTLNRLMRWSGYGWSCGYHACNDNGWGLRDGLPPVGNTAPQINPAVPGKFELVHPVHPVWHSGAHAIQGHYHTPVTHDNFGVTMPMSSLPVGTVPMLELGESLVVPQGMQASETFPPYRSAVPPKAPRAPSTKSEPENSEEASPSDLDLLPSPKDKADDLLLEDSSVRLVAPRNRSARMSVASEAR